MTKFSIMEKFFKGQQELGIPNYFVTEEGVDWLNAKAISKKTPSVCAPAAKTEMPNLAVSSASPRETVQYTENTPNTPQYPQVAQVTPRLQTSPIPQFQTSKQEVAAQADKRELLVALYNKHKDCVACSLCKTRKKFVFGAGTAFTDVLIIGEAPGEQEDIEGKPFVGAAGQLLTKMLAAINISRDAVFIANVLKCRPPGNRKPNSAEIATCSGILKKQIEIIKPAAILLLGGTAANAVLQTGAEKSVASLRGIVHYCENIPAIVSYHPSALLRDASWKKPAWDDLQKFERLLKEIRNVG